MALKHILERNRLDQAMVAEALSVSRISVGNWVHGRSVPSGTNLVKLLEYLRQFEPTLRVEDILPSVAPDLVEAAPESEVTR